MLRTHVLPRVASVFLGVGIILQLAFIGRMLLGVREAPQSPAARVVRGAAKNAELNVDAIVQAHLFGLAPVLSSEDAGTPLSSHSLQLSATFATNDPARGYAILGDSGRPSQVRSAGEALPGGARLHQVFRDYVILDRGGTMEKLILRPHAAGADGGGGAPRSAAARNPARAVPAEQTADADDDSHAPVKMATFQLLPVFGARDSGARIGLIKNPEQFGKTGLTAGDIVIAVNGTPVHDAPSAANLLRAGGGRPLTLTVKRGAQLEDIKVDSLD